MASIQVENIPDELYEAVRREARSAGKPVSRYVLDVLVRALSDANHSWWLETLTTSDPPAARPER